MRMTLIESLESYYESIDAGDLLRLSTLMTRESYLMSLNSLGFKKAFQDESFRRLLKEMEKDSKALLEVEEILSLELRGESRKYDIETLLYESKGSDRVTLRYSQDENPKKIHFSNQEGVWKIDFKAGRKKDL